MLYQITDGTVSAGGKVILSHINFQIHGTEKIAVVGKNGAGKTTLLKLIAGELSLDRDDRRQGPGITCSRQVTIGMLSQQVSAPAPARTALTGNGLNTSGNMISCSPVWDSQRRTRKSLFPIFPAENRQRSH